MSDCTVTASVKSPLDKMLSRSARLADMDAKLNAILDVMAAGNAKRTVTDSLAACNVPAEIPAQGDATCQQRVMNVLVDDGSGQGRLDGEDMTPPAGTGPESLAERIARIEARLWGLPAFEASVTDLVARFGTIEATHVEPIRQAAQLEVRRAVEAERAAAEAEAPSTLSAIEQIRAELVAARRERAGEDHRLDAILQSLGTSLEKVTNRLNTLESAADRMARSVVKGPVTGETPRTAPSQTMGRRPLIDTITARLGRRATAAFA